MLSGATLSSSCVCPRSLRAALDDILPRRILSHRYPSDYRSSRVAEAISCHHPERDASTKAAGMLRLTFVLDAVRVTRLAEGCVVDSTSLIATSLHSEVDVKFLLTAMVVVVFASTADAEPARPAKLRLAGAQTDACVASCATQNASCKRVCPTTLSAPCVNSCDSQMQTCVQSCQNR